MRFTNMNNFVIFVLKIMWFFGKREFYTINNKNEKIKMYISEWVFLKEVCDGNYKKAIKYVDDIFDNMCEVPIGLISKFVFDKVDVFATIEFSKVIEVFEKYRDKSDYILLLLANSRFVLPITCSKEVYSEKLIEGINFDYMRKLRNDLIPLVNKRNEFSAEAALILGKYYYFWEVDKKNGFKYMCLSVQLGNSNAYGEILRYFGDSDGIDIDEAKNLISYVECNIRNEIVYGKSTSASISSLLTMHIGGVIVGKENRSLDKLKKLIDNYSYMFDDNVIAESAIEMSKVACSEYQDEQSREIYLYLKNKLKVKDVPNTENEKENTYATA